MAITIFLDDGGVLNDNEIRGQQWKIYVGEYYSSRFGGKPEIWGEANQKLITSLFDIFWKNGIDHYKDYLNYHSEFKKNMVLGMFKGARKIPPRNLNIEEVFNSATQYVIPKVRSAIPGVIECVNELTTKGYVLYTAAAIVSVEMKMYLEGMGIIHHFKEFYGPDLVNTWKSRPDYYRAIFKHSGVDPKKSIIIDDQPRFLEKCGNKYHPSLYNWPA